MENNLNEDPRFSTEVIIAPQSGITRTRKPPQAKALQEWVQERVAEDAEDLYDDLKKAIKAHLGVHYDERGIPTGPTVKVMELAADVLKMRDTGGGGVNINQNFGNTTINNNGGASFEEIVRKQQARSNLSEVIIDAEIVEPSV